MSITKGFEKGRWRADAFTADTLVYGQNDVDQLLTHARDLEAMLRKLEWADTDDFGDRYCPECEMSRLGGDHTTDCQLAKLLDGVE